MRKATRRWDLRLILGRVRNTHCNSIYEQNAVRRRLRSEALTPRLLLAADFPAGSIDAYGEEAPAQSDHT